jgi:MFS family permease
MAVTAGRRGRRPPWPTVAGWSLWGLGTVAFLVAAWLNQRIRRAGRPDLAPLTTAGTLPLLLASISAATVGAVLVSRRPRHPVGWLLLGLGVSLITLGAASDYATYVLLAGGGPLPGARWAALLSDTGWVLWPAAIGFILLLTPTGSPPSPRWRWWVWLTAAAPLVYMLAEALQRAPMDPPFQTVVSPLALPATVPLEGVLANVDWIAALVIQVAILVAAGSLVLRFRRARGVERLQLRWVALAAALAGVAAVGVAVGTVIGVEALWLVSSFSYITVLPLTIGASILRYRLYDLDRILSRTLAWTVLTVFLVGGYALAVLGLGQLLGRDSSLVVAAATLAVAAVFQPARRRIQAAVDRRFNRHRYDAARTIAAFSGRLRQQVDLDSLSAELLAVTDQTMQPTTVSLWLRPRR